MPWGKVGVKCQGGVHRESGFWLENRICSPSVMWWERGKGKWLGGEGFTGNLESKGGTGSGGREPPSGEVKVHQVRGSSDQVREWKVDMEKAQADGLVLIWRAC